MARRTGRSPRANGNHRGRRLTVMRDAGGKHDACSSPGFSKRNSEKQVLRPSLSVASGHGVPTI